jgi:hypothetical protein
MSVRSVNQAFARSRPKLNPTTGTVRAQSHLHSTLIRCA